MIPTLSPTFHRALLAIAVLALAPTVSAAQGAPGGARTATRLELQQAAEQFERQANGAGVASAQRERARLEVIAIRRRLVEGDFRFGERIYVRIDGAPQPISDTLVVRDSLSIDIPGIRRVRLRGVLRSELQTVILGEVAQVLRNAQVQAIPLMRLGVLGAVARPGFRSIPAESFVDQLVEAGGGLAPNAATGKMRLVRGTEVLVAGNDVFQAIADARTLESLGIRDGDVLEVPQRAPAWDRAATFQVISLILAPLLALAIANR